MLSWGFDFILNRGTSSQDNSANIVLDWWRDVHFNFKTLLVGDGLYMNPNGVGYYMNTDIGYFRQIYYGGIVGLILILYYQYKIVTNCYRCLKTCDMRFLTYALFASLLAILAKGDADMFSEYILFLVFIENGIFYKVDKHNTNHERI